MPWPSTRSRARLVPPVAAVIAAVLLAGCGGDEDTQALGIPGQPGEGGTLTWEISGKVKSVDPLAADARFEQLVSRQIHEPLIESLAGPFGDTRRLPGLALRARPRGDQAIWNISLRRGVRFQDGTPFGAAAVLANAERWMTTDAGREVIPGLQAADSPRPGLVRLFLSAPDPELPDKLALPRLGIVSPRALRPRSGTGAVVRDPFDTGTGAFELRERTNDRLLLARNTAWWGTSAELGPALDQLEFMVEPVPAARLAALEDGTAQLADQLPDQEADLARANPLLELMRSDGDTWLGIERSVRGVDSGREIPSLSGAWLTAVTVAE